MVKAKTGITFLKRLGFVLIAMPEPFTTPFGVACVVASGYLSRLRETALNKHLHETLTRYLSHTKRSNDETDNKSHARQNVKRGTRTETPTILWQNKSSLPVKTSHPIAVRQNRRDKEDNTVLHSIDTKSLTRRYPVTVSPKAETVSSPSDITPEETEKLIHHSVDKKSLSRRYPVTDSPKAETVPSNLNVTPVETEKLIQHSIDMRMLGRRYGAGDSSKVASSPADKSSPDENVVHHARHISLSRRFEGNTSARTNSKVKPMPDIDETIEHHSINIKALSQRYQSGGVGQLGKAKRNTVNSRHLVTSL